MFQLFLGSTAISHCNVTVNRNKPNVSKESHFYHSPNLVLCLALYGRELEEEEEDEEEDEEQLEVHRLPDLLFRKAPQLLQYTAALHTRYGSDDDDHDDSDGGDNVKDFGIQRDRRGELRLDSHIGTVKSVRDDTYMHLLVLLLNLLNRKLQKEKRVTCLHFCFSVPGRIVWG